MVATHQAPDWLKYQLQNVKNLYAELFLLLVTSVEEDPLGDQPIGGNDAVIEQLMDAIEDNMKQFRDALDGARAAESLPPELSHDIHAFEDQLKEGLSTMAARVQARTEEMQLERNAIRERLGTVKQKKRGAKGYRSPRETTSALMDSQI